MNTSLTLKNPAWAKLAVDSARECQARGVLDAYFEANAFNEEVKQYILSHL